MRYQIVAEAYRDLEAASGRLQMIERLAELFRQTPDDLLPTVALLCQGQIAPDSPRLSSGWPSGWPPGRSPRPSARPPSRSTRLAGATGRRCRW